MRQSAPSTMAAASGKAAEFETALQLAAQTDKNRKKIVIGLEGQCLPLADICNTLQLCQRVGASLEILRVTEPLPGAAADEKELNFLEGQCKNLNIRLHTVRGNRSLNEVLVDLTRKRREVVFVVLPANPALTTKRRDLKGLTQKIPCPVVLYQSRI